MATFTDEGTCYACGVSQEGARITAGGSTNQVHVIQLEGVAPGPTVVTGWWVSHSLAQRILHRSAPLPAFGCPHCRTWSVIPESALGSELPCPNCGKVVRLNPFTIEADWRPVAAAWKG